MVANRKQIVPESLANEVSPIQYLTENGFSIIRLSDVDKSVVDTPSKCRFLVRTERGWEREVAVDFDEQLISQIQLRRRTSLSNTSVVWLVCAEQCLATYLWENNKYPENGQLSISELPPDELLLAAHWTDERDNEPFARSKFELS